LGEEQKTGDPMKRKGKRNPRKKKIEKIIRGSKKSSAPKTGSHILQRKRKSRGKSEKKRK